MGLQSLGNWVARRLYRIQGFGQVGMLESMVTGVECAHRLGDGLDGEGALGQRTLMRGPWESR